MSLTEDMLQNPEKIELYEDMVREKKRLADLCSQNAKNAVLMAEPVHYPAPVSSDFRHPNPKRNRVDIPEEVTLRRHFIQNFVAKLEENSPRPTDNTLVRHYNQWLDSEVENLIYQSG